MIDRSPSAEHLELLRARAANLAEIPSSDRQSDVTLCVAFRVGGQRYALDARAIEEVSPLRNLTPLPSSAAPLFGLTHWRGGVLPVLDLRPALRLDINALTDLSRLIVLEGPRQPFSFVADALEGMTEIRAGQLSTPGNESMESGESLVQGIAPDGTVVLDPSAIVRWGT